MIQLYYKTTDCTDGSNKSPKKHRIPAKHCSQSPFSVGSNIWRSPQAHAASLPLETVISSNHASPSLPLNMPYTWIDLMGLSLVMNAAARSQPCVPGLKGTLNPQSLEPSEYQISTYKEYPASLVVPETSLDFDHIFTNSGSDLIWLISMSCVKPEEASSLSFSTCAHGCGPEPERDNDCAKLYPDPNGFQ